MKHINSNKLVLALFAMLAVNASWDLLHDSSHRNTQVYEQDFASLEAHKTFKTSGQSETGNTTINLTSKVQIDTHSADPNISQEWSDERSTKSEGGWTISGAPKTPPKKVEYTRIRITTNNNCSQCSPQTYTLLIQKVEDISEAMGQITEKLGRLASNAADKKEKAEIAAKERKEKAEAAKKLAAENKEKRDNCKINSKGDKISSSSKHRVEHFECLRDRLAEETDEKEVKKLWRMARPAFLKLARSTNSEERTLVAEELEMLSGDFLDDEDHFAMGDQMRTLSLTAQTRSRLAGYAQELALLPKDDYRATYLKYQIDQEILNYRKYTPKSSFEGSLLQSQLAGELTVFGRQIFEDPQRVARTNGIGDSHYNDALAALGMGSQVRTSASRLALDSGYTFKNYQRPTNLSLPTTHYGPRIRNVERSTVDGRRRI